VSPTGHLTVAFPHMEMTEVPLGGPDGGPDVILLDVHVEAVQQELDRRMPHLVHKGAPLLGGVQQALLEPVDDFQAIGHSPVLRPLGQLPYG